MTDIARAAGCSQATVSLVLNDVRGIKISANTRARIIEIARDLNYGESSLIITRMSPASAANIGVIVDVISPEVAAISEGVRDASEAGTSVLLIQTRNDPERFRQAAEAMVDAAVVGIIFMAAKSQVVHVPERIVKAEVPIVFVNYIDKDGLFPSLKDSDFGFMVGPHLYNSDIEKIVDIIFDEIVATLEQGGRVEIRGFGVFSVRHRPSRSGRNPRSGRAVFVEEKWVPFFKSGKDIQIRLNSGGES